MAKYSVFTKPWKDVPVDELIRIVTGMGYNSIEFPLRDGSQVCPAEAEEKLPKLVKQLGDAGIVIDDVASSTEERVFAACAASKIPMIRVMFNPPQADDYPAQEYEYCKLVDSWIPLCEKYGVKVGVQMHHGRGAMTTADMMRVVSRFDPKHIGAIWTQRIPRWPEKTRSRPLTCAGATCALPTLKTPAGRCMEETWMAQPISSPISAPARTAF